MNSGLDPRSTRVADIMTPNPMVVTTDRSATDALNLMVQKGFRHLVCLSSLLFNYRRVKDKLAFKLTGNKEKR